MTNRPTATPPGRSDDRNKGKATPPTNTRISRPVAAKEPPRRDLFGLYFIGGATIFILIFGFIVFFSRANRGAVPTPTATPTQVLVQGLPTVEIEGSPLPDFTPPAVPTDPAPDALTSGNYVTGGEQVNSQVGEVNPDTLPANIPPQVPQPKLVLSEDSVDWGDVDPAQTPQATIVLANPAARDLVIRGLYTDCSCITASIEAKTVKTGERTRLHISYTPSSDTADGNVLHKVSIVSTDGQHPLIEVSLRAYNQ